MKRKITCIALCTLLLAPCSSAEAQQPKKIHRIGLLSSTRSGPITEEFRQALQALGFNEGKNIVIEYRYAEGKDDRLPELAAELVSLNVDLIVVVSTQAAIAAKQASTTIPIVMAISGDVVGTGVIKSLSHPGGNVTGMTTYSPEVNGKRLALLKETFPKISRVAVLGDPTGPSHPLDWQELKPVARHLAVQLQSLEVRSPKPDFKGAFAAATKARADAFLTLPPPLMAFHQKEIVALVAKSRRPAIFHNGDFADSGGLMSYGPDARAGVRRAAIFVDKILTKGAKPADLPVEQPMKYEFIINLKTAKQIGLNIPQSVLFRADRVIQ
jgi:putative ABC transport system substrate-binding protein